MVFHFVDSQKGNVAFKPIIFVFGISGVGKDHASKRLESCCSLKWMDLERDKYRVIAGITAEWEKTISEEYISNLADRVQDQLNKNHRGAVLSFPPRYLFSRERFDKARNYGVGVILLWGQMKLCWNDRYKRQNARYEQSKEERNKPLEYPEYCDKYQSVFKHYEHSDFDKFRLEAFEPDLSRPSPGKLLDRILEKLADQGILWIEI